MKNTIKKYKYRKICSSCFEYFETNYHNQKFCSDECRELDKKASREIFLRNRKIYLKKCEICSKEFETNRPNQKFCSNECREIYYEKGKTYKYTKTCEICNKKFETNQPNYKFCSDKCREQNYENNKNLNKYKSKPKKTINKENYDDIVSFTVKELIRKGIEGRNKSEISRFYISYGFTSSLKDEVKDRDNWTCRICGNKHRLEVHHIVKVIHGGENELDNLITLCTSCHRAIDTLDLDHALKRCKKNAEKYLGIENKIIDYRTTKEKVEDIGFDLRAIYNIIRKSSDDPDMQDALVRFNDVLEEVEEIAGF